MPQLEAYEVSPIQIINGLVTTERSGLGKWGRQSMEGFFQFCSYLRKNLPDNFTMVEVGSYAGESTLGFCYIAGQVIAIDPWINGYDPDDLSANILPMKIVEESFIKRTSICTNLSFHKTTSEEAAKDITDHSLDFVYIDAIHRIGPCKEDLQRWIPKIKVGGMIGGHDFCGYWGEVVDAVLEIVGLPDVRFKDGSWAKRIVR